MFIGSGEHKVGVEGGRARKESVQKVVFINKNINETEEKTSWAVK